MWTYPGKKLLFMGGEFAQRREWNHDRELDWNLLDEHTEGSVDHRSVQALVRDLNQLYRGVAALHELDCDPAGFEWITPDDSEHSVIAYARIDRAGKHMLVVSNFTPNPWVGYRVGVSQPGTWRLRLNTDDPRYGGSGYADLRHGDRAPSEEHSSDGRPHSVQLILPPLATLILEPLDE